MAAKKKIKTQAVESKPELKEYLRKLAPDFSVLDMVDQYCEQGYPLKENNLLNTPYIFNDLFVYYDNSNNTYTNDFDSNGMRRGLFKYELNDGSTLKIKPDTDYCTSAIYDNNILIVVSKAGFSISGIKYLCGVFF